MKGEYRNGGCAVKRSKFTEGQIAFALKQADVWTPVEEEGPKMGIAERRSTTGEKITRVDRGL